MWQNLSYTTGAQSDSPLRQVHGDAAACESTGHVASGAHGGDPEAGADDFDEHRYLSLLATMSKWMVRILVESMRKHPRPQVANRFHTIGYTLSWQTSAVSGTIREAFWHAQRFRRDLVMVSMDIRQCFDHMDNRRVIRALQERQLPRWLVRGYAREVCPLKARARIADADWTPEFDFSKGGKTGVDSPALLKSLPRGQHLALRTRHDHAPGHDRRSDTQSAIAIWECTGSQRACRSCMQHTCTEGNVTLSRLGLQKATD